jgi:hypothetical protein
MNTQNETRSLRIKASLRRTALAVFAACLLASLALLSVIAGGGYP